MDCYYWLIQLIFFNISNQPMRAADYSLRAAQHLFELRRQRMQAAKASPKDVNYESESTHESKLEGSGSNLAISCRISRIQGQETTQQCKREDSSGTLTSFSLEVMDVEEETFRLSNRQKQKQATKAKEDILVSPCFERVKSQEENVSTLKDALMNDLTQKMRERCPRGDQGKKCRDGSQKANRGDLEKQLRKCFSIPDREEEPIEVKPRSKPRPIVEMDEETAKAGRQKGKRVTFYNKRMTRGYVRNLRMIQSESEESMETVEPEDVLTQFNIAKYRYENPELSERIGELHTRLSSLVRLRKKTAKVDDNPEVKINSEKHRHFLQKVRERLRRQQIYYIE